MNHRPPSRVMCFLLVRCFGRPVGGVHRYLRFTWKRGESAFVSQSTHRWRPPGRRPRLFRGGRGLHRFCRHASRSIPCLLQRRLCGGVGFVVLVSQGAGVRSSRVLLSWSMYVFCVSARRQHGAGEENSPVAFTRMWAGTNSFDACRRAMRNSSSSESPTQSDVGSRREPEGRATMTSAHHVRTRGSQAPRFFASGKPPSELAGSL